MVELVLLLFGLFGALAVGRSLAAGLGWTYETTLSEVLFSITVGLLVLQALLFIFGVSGLLYHGVLQVFALLWGGLGVWALIKWWPWLSAQAHGVRGAFSWYQLVALILASVGLFASLVRALAPPHGSTDPLAYQLALPKLYLLHHGLTFEPSINGTLYPAAVNLLYMLGLAVGGDSMPQVVHLSLGVLAAAAVVGLAQDLASLRAGFWGALVFSLTPVLAYYGPLGYVDAGVCYFQLMAFWALFRWLDRQQTDALLLAALLTGAAMATKPHAAVTLVFGLGFVLLARAPTRAWRLVLRDAALFAAVAGVVVGPWYLRSYIDAGNPVWPLANGWFGGVPFGRGDFGLPGFVRQATGQDGAIDGATAFLAGAASRFGDRLDAFWEWTWAPSDWQHAIGVHYLALLPGLALVPLSTGLRRLLALCVVYYLTAILLLHANPRYNLVLLALLAVPCGHVIEGLFQCNRWAGRLVALALVVSAGLGACWSCYMAKPLVPVVTGQVTKARFLKRHEPTYGLFEYVNTTLPESARILLQGIVKGFYCDRDYLWDHPFQRVVHYSDYGDVAALSRRLRELGVTHVARMISVPPTRMRLGYPQYFTDAFHEEFRRRYLELIYHDDRYALFEVHYEGRTTQ